jgi:hypothetical protein
VANERRGFVRELINRVESDGAWWRGGQGVSRGTRERQVTDAVRPVRRAELSDAAVAALTLTRTRGQSVFIHPVYPAGLPSAKASFYDFSLSQISI